MGSIGNAVGVVGAAAAAAAPVWRQWFAKTRWMIGRYCSATSGSPHSATAKCTSDQNQSLATALRELTRIVDDTKGINKERMDRRIGRLLKILPPDLSQPIALECISHKRKSCRTAGLKGLKLETLDETTSRYLIDCFDSSNDVRILKALLRYPIILDSVEPTRLIALFQDDDYWQMRVVDATLRADKNVGLHFAQTLPASFVWAAGRIGDRTLLSAVSNCFDVANDKLHLIGIVS